ncbi:hypothetical protein [Cytobacillus oceanisediminis]
MNPLQFEKDRPLDRLVLVGGGQGACALLIDRNNRRVNSIGIPI